MTDRDTQPWLNRYKGVPPTIEPPAKTGLAVFRNTLARAPDAPLVHYFDQTITTGEIDRMSDALAVALQQRGVEPGDRVAMYLQNIPQVMVTVLAGWKCGAVIVPCNPMLRETELVKILSDSGSRVLICQEDLYADIAQAALPATAVLHTITTSPLEFLDPIANLPPVLAGFMRIARPADVPDMFELIASVGPAKPEDVLVSSRDVAFMVYTSGTTGAPKAAMNTHSNVVFATAVYERWIGLDQRDTILGLAPLFHVTGQAALKTRDRFWPQAKLL
jgi:long-chain acyl-CoA synthetase